MKLPASQKPLLSIVALLCMIAALNAAAFPAAPGGGDKNDILRKICDPSVPPGKDFFKYSTGTWMKENPIPAAESRWGVGNLVQEETYARLRKISEEAASNPNPVAGSALQKIGAMWATGMDTVTIERQGIKPLQAEFDRINSIKDVKDLLNVVALFQTYSVTSMFDFGVMQDQMNSEKMAVYVFQGGLGLPNRDYYFNTDERTANIRKEYLAHLGRMFQLLGDDAATAGKEAQAIMKIETDLAAKSRKLADLRDPYKNYNKKTVSEVNGITPTIDWAAMLTKLGIANPDTIILGQPEFLEQLEVSLKSVSIADWKSYLRFHLLNAFAPYLSKAVDGEQFAFRGKTLDGRKEQRPRWKRVLDVEEAGMGELLGQLYVQNFVPVAMKRRYEKLTQDILDAYKERIEKLDWMSAETKSKALQKLGSVTKKVCYPDKWRDYSALSQDRDSYVMNVLRTRVWSYNYQIAKLGKPVDRMEWDMTPQTYNAYYNPSNNEIVLPAAQFVIPGVPDSLCDDAMIYAYAGGSTIGHEITHGFDDEGRQYDDKGNLSDWWTKEDGDKFNKRAQVMADQFSSYVVLDTMHVNGQATLGENIADLGGIILGYEAFQKTQQAKEGKSIAGFTPNQRYFLAYALSWLGHQRDQRTARQIMTDVHSPAFLRVNGPLSDMPEFYEAFGIKEGDAMWRSENLRAKIW